MIDTIKKAIAIINESSSKNLPASARTGAAYAAAPSLVDSESPVAQAIADWRLVERNIQRQERYYIVDRAEQARSIDEVVYSLTVYVDSIDDVSHPSACSNENTPDEASTNSAPSSEKVDSSEAPRRFRGEATITIFPSFSLEECVVKIRQAVFAASKSHNPWFSLPAPSPLSVQVPTSGFEALSFEDRVKSIRSALYSPFEQMNQPKAVPIVDSLAMPKNVNPRINSLELFISKEQRRLLNSQGIDYSRTIWRGYSEFVVEADSPADIASNSPADSSADSPSNNPADSPANSLSKNLADGSTDGSIDGSANNPYSTVELFDDIEFSEPDPARLAQSIGNRLIQVSHRALAKPMPKLSGIPLILRGKEAEEIFSWFFENSRTEAIYSKASPFGPGVNVQGGNENIEAEHKGDGAIIEPLDLWAEPVISGLPASAAFDSDGFPLERTLVIENGILKTLIGSVRHADWLGVPRKGAFSLFSVPGGSMSLEEMHAKPYLEPVMFSDFRLDSMTGDFGAEVRLAYYFDGKNVTPVTRGSISGSMSTMRTTMRRSKETATMSRSVCPIAVMLQGAIIAGARY